MVINSLQPVNEPASPPVNEPLSLVNSPEPLVNSNEPTLSPEPSPTNSLSSVSENTPPANETPTVNANPTIVETLNLPTQSHDEPPDRCPDCLDLVEWQGDIGQCWGCGARWLWVNGRLVPLTDPPTGGENLTLNPDAKHDEPHKPASPSHLQKLPLSQPLNLRNPPETATEPPVPTKSISRAFIAKDIVVDKQVGRCFECGEIDVLWDGDVGFCESCGQGYSLRSPKKRKQALSRTVSGLWLKVKKVQTTQRHQTFVKVV